MHVIVSFVLVALFWQVEMSASSSSSESPPLTTHILDTARGVPAANVNMTLWKRSNSGEWVQLQTRQTSNDGRGGFLGGSNEWGQGIYKLYFDTGAYFASHHTKGFYPYVEVVFQIDEPLQHYHVPLLLSPFGYSTYRGS